MYLLFYSKYFATVFIYPVTARLKQQRRTKIIKNSCFFCCIRVSPIW